MMNGYLLKAFIVFFLFLVKSPDAHTQKNKSSLDFKVTMLQPGTHRFHVEFHCNGVIKDTIEFKMPAWMPGYYQLMNYADNVENFNASSVEGRPLKWEKSGRNGW